MSAPYDAAAAEIADVIDDMIDGVITPLAAGPLISEQLKAVAPTQFLQYEKIIRVLGRVEGMLITDGPPTPDIGAIDSTCIDITNHRFYGPKTSDGWGEGVVFAGADVGSYIEELGFITPDQYGAVGNGVANDTAALQAALNTGLNVIRPPGKTYMHNATLTMNTSGQAFTGGGKLRTVGSIDSILVTGGAVGVKLDLTFNSPGQTGGYTVKIDNAHRTQLNSLLVEDGYGTLWVEGANVVDIGFLWASCRGPGIKWFGDADSRSDILNIKFALIDPGAGHYGFDWDGNCHSLETKYLGIVCGSTVGAGNSKGFIVRNTSGGPAPAIGRLTHVEVDYPTGPGIEIAAGSDFDLANSYSLGSNDSALKVGASINTGEVRVSGGKYRGATRYGIENLGGPILYSGNADLSSNGLGETSGNVWTVTPRLVLGTTASGHYLTTIGANPLWAWEGDSYMAFDVAGNSRNTTIGGTLIEALNATGLSITGVGTFTGYSSAGGGYYVPSGQAIQFDLGVSGNYNVYKTGTSLALTTGGDFLLQTSGGHSVSLRPDGANDVLAQYRGTSAQTFRIYNTRTDASNYERATFGWAANALVIGTEAAGTGSGRNLQLSTSGTSRWQVNAASGHFIAVADNTYDFGASGANRARTGYFGTSVFAATSIGIGVTTAASPLTVQSASVANPLATFNDGTGYALAYFGSAVDTPNGRGYLTLRNPGTDGNGSGVQMTSNNGANSAVFSLDGSGNVVFRVQGNTTTSVMVFDNFGTNAGNEIRFRTGGANNRLVIGNTGNILISTATALLQFGGTTNAFPAWKRSGAGWDARLADDSGLTFVGASSLILNGQATLTTDAANILAQRNGVNAQRFNIYNTYTDASNYERGYLEWDTNEFVVGTTFAGTGSHRGLSFETGNVARWKITTSSHFVAALDNTYDIGASGANRPRNVYVAGFLVTGGSIEAGFASRLGFNGRGGLNGVADGVLSLTDNAGTNFTRLTFGGTTSAFPSLKRSGTTLAARLADDSADAPFTAASFSVTSTSNMNGSSLIGVGNLTFGASYDLTLARDSANILAQRNGTAAQFFRVYNTYTDASNSERLAIGWNANTCFIATENSGTGSTRNLVIRAGNQLDLSGSSGSNGQWNLLSNGTFRPGTDNTFDLGQSGVRVRTGYFGTSIVIAGVTVIPSTSAVTNSTAVRDVNGFLTAAGYVLSSASPGFHHYETDAAVDGKVWSQRVNSGVLTWAVENDSYSSPTTFMSVTRSGLTVSSLALTAASINLSGRVQFGGTSNLFPALKQSGADLHLRLADDSNFGNFVCNSATANTFIGTAGLFVDTYCALNLVAGVSTLFYDNGDQRAFTRGTNTEVLSIGGVAIQTMTATKAEFSVPVKLPRYTVANLPAAASSTDMHALVTDALTPAWRATVAGGGAELVMVRSNGTNWIVVG
ncbi:MAG: beta strand repeat-containing protein [Brevundimonas sp.]